MQARDLCWEGCLNVRDLGGNPTEDGGETRFGFYVRAASIDRLTDAGWRAVVEYGVRTIVDLRLEDERALRPPQGLPLEVVHQPLRPAFDHPWWDAQPLLAPAEATRMAYLAFLEGSAGEIGSAVRAIAGADEGAVLFHCMGGKDRTGLVAALLLRAAGVRQDAILADYSISAGNLGAWLEAWIDGAEDDEERRRRASVGGSPAEAMAGVLEAVDERYGSAAGYLAGAGVPEELVERVRSRLLG